MNNGDRQPLIIKETKDTINRIKSSKVERLEVVSKVLSTATMVAGVITAIDLIVPDPVFGIDEAALTAITALIGTGKGIVDKQIASLKESDSYSYDQDQVNDLAKKIKGVHDAFKASKGNNFTK
jgi:hypothetical protein